MVLLSNLAAPYNIFMTIGLPIVLSQTITWVGIRPPPYDAPGTTILDGEKKHVDPIKSTWLTKGVTIVSCG